MALRGGGFPANSVESLALHIDGLVSAACCVSTKRLKFRNNKRGVYWWSEEVSQVRRRCIAIRRLLTRRRKRGGRCDDLIELYKKARAALCKAIKKAKSDAWGNLIQTLHNDPWGIPYKVMMDRLRHSGSTLSVTLEPRIVEGLLSELFPAGEVHDPEVIWGGRAIDESGCQVSVEEVIGALRGRRRGDCPAPDPDGLSLTVWKPPDACWRN